MKTNIKYVISVACLICVLAVALPTFAQTSLITSSTKNEGQRTRMASTTNPTAISKLIAQSDKEVVQRINSLNALLTRVQAMKKVSDAGKANISSQIQAEITNLNNLKAKIDADTDTTTLKADLKTITADYRIYMLIVPQIQIIAASDRIDTISTNFSTVVAKLQTRITAAQTAGKDVSSVQTAMTDIQSKITDAQTQAQNAVNGVSALIPDQGNQTTAQANTSALKSARTDIKNATQDLQTADRDAKTIVKILISISPKSQVSASSTKTN